MKIPLALTVAGSDSGGGAGIQADLKTFTALGVYGLSVLTSLTAQNTTGVQSIFDLPVKFIESQFDSVLTDIGCDAVKIGMLSDEEIIRSVTSKLSEYKVTNIVLDPVMVSKGGSRLLKEGAVSTLVESLIPLSLVITPNLREAEVLSGFPVSSRDDMKRAAEKIKSFGCRNVIVTGGHLEGDTVVDILFDGSRFIEFSEVRINTKNTHGTGCTYSSAICAGLAKGYVLADSVKYAKHYTTNAIKHSLDIGKGHGPLMHYWDII